MAPIVIASTTSSDEINNEIVVEKRRVDRHSADDGELVAEERDYDKRDDDDRQSGLFEEEKKAAMERIQTSYAYAPTLSLMQSCSPVSSCGGLEDVHVTPVANSSGEKSTLFDDFAIDAVDVLNQIDSDEALARQLQDEENKKQPKPKTRVVPSVADSILGEPFPWEVRSNYSKVTGGSVSGGLFSISDSFKKWGDEISAAASEFFGEDVALQVRSSSSRGRNAI